MTPIQRLSTALLLLALAAGSAGAGPGRTVLDGEGLSQALSLDGDSLRVEGLTIRNGNSAVGGDIGGAIQFQENGDGRHEFVVRRSVFRDNFGAGAGGAVEETAGVFSSGRSRGGGSG